MAEEGGPAVLPAQRQRPGPGRRPQRGQPCARRRPVVGQGSQQVRRLDRQPLSGRRFPVRPGRDRAAGRLRRAQRGADAVFREHRRLCGRGLDGRRLGDGRQLRPDRKKRAPVRRGGNRRGAGAVAGQPDHHRGWLFHRGPRRSRRGGDRPRGRGAGHGRLSVGLDEDHRPGDRRGVPGRSPGVFGCGAGQPARSERRPVAVLRGDRQAGGRSDAGQDRREGVAAGLSGPIHFGRDKRDKADFGKRDVGDIGDIRPRPEFSSPSPAAPVSRRSRR